MNSTSNSNSNNNSEEKVQEIQNNIQEAMEKENKKLRELYGNVKQSLAKDSSTPNVIINFSKLLATSKPNLDCIESSVEDIKKGWNGVMKHVKTIKKLNNKRGQEKTKTITKLYADYFELLLKTKCEVSYLLQMCAFQKDNISDLVGFFSKGNNGELKKCQKSAFDECIQCLGIWIGAEQISSLIKEWVAMTARVQEEFDSEDWELLAKEAEEADKKAKEAKEAKKANAAKETKKGWSWKQILCGTIAIIGVIAVVAVAVIASGGAAAPAIVGTGIATTTVVKAATFAVGLVIVGGFAVYGLQSKETGAEDYDYKKQAVAIRSDINALTAELEKMLRTSKGMQVSLNDLKIAENNIGVGFPFMKNKKETSLVVAALNKLTAYLDEYTRQGKCVITAIDNAVKECAKN